MSDLRDNQIIIFLLGWIAYASTYLLRKPLGVVKADMEEVFAISKPELGWLDTAMLFPYAFVQIILGPLGDKIGSRVTLSCCLIMSALSMITFGMWTEFHAFFIILFLNGAAQSLCWPNCVKIVGLWFPDKVRNSVFGIYGTSAFGGGIMGTALAVFIQGIGWREVYLVPSLIVLFIGILVFAFFKEPAEANIEVPGREVASDKQGNTKMKFLDVIKIPMVIPIAVAVFCLKVVRYCMFMWLPMYLYEELKYTRSQAGIFSITFEVGGIFGSALIGFVLDKYYSQQPLIGTFFSIILSGVCLIFFTWTSSWGLFANNLFMFLAGAFNCGPDSILGAAVPSKIGELNGRNAGAAIVGFVNGFGSLGTVVEGPIIGTASSMYGWSGMFYLMIALSVCGSLAVLKAAFVQRRLEKNSLFEEA
ncbi:sugar phosphate exchanger 3-like [Argonauta hians]